MECITCITDTFIMDTCITLWIHASIIMDTCTMDAPIMSTYIMDTFIMDTCIMDICIMDTSMWVTRPERPKGAKDEVKEARKVAD